MPANCKIAIAMMLMMLLVLPAPQAMAESGNPASLDQGLIKETVLQNGLKVIILEEHSFPVFSSMMFYRVGSRNENLGESGLSHLVEHLLFQRVGKYRKGEIGAVIARNGGMFNGFTSDDFTVYFETMAPSKLDLALKIEADRMRLAAFSQEEVGAEIKRIEKELELEARDQANLLVKEVRSAAFQRHPYKNPTIGWQTDVQKLTLDDVKRHYREYYQPGNATLVIVGDVDAGAALEQARKAFGGIAGGETPRAVRVVEPPQKSEKRVYLKYGGSADILSLAYHAPAFTDADALPIAVLEKILVSGIGGRLKSQLVESKICSQARATFEVKRDPGLFLVNLNAVPGVGAGKTLEAFDSAIDQIKNSPVSENELKRARNHAELQLLSERDGPYRNAFHLGFFDCLDSWTQAYLWSTRLRSVSAADIQRVAKRYLVSENRVVGVLSGARSDSKTSVKSGDKPVTASPAAKSGDAGKKEADKKPGTKKTEGKKNEPKKDDKHKSSGHPRHTASVPAFGGLHMAAYDGTLIAQDGSESDSGPGVLPAAAPQPGAQTVPVTPQPRRRNMLKKAVLKNGMTIAVLETKVSPTVQIVGAIKAGDAYETVGKRGVASLLARLSNESTRYTHGQAVAIQDELGLSPQSMIKFESGPQWLSFSSRCLARDTGTILNIMAAQIKTPLLTDAAFESSKQQVLERIKKGGGNDSARSRVDRALVQGLIAPNTSFYPLEPVDRSRFVGNLKLADVRDFHQQAVKPDACTMVFIGDIELAQAVSLCERAFDGFSGVSSAKKVVVQPSPRRLLKNSIIVERPQDAMVTLGKLVDTTNGAPDYALLLLSDCALTSHPIFSRFAQKISGETSLQSSLSLEDLSGDVESMPGANLWSIDIPMGNAMPGAVKSIQSELKKFSKLGLTGLEYNEARLYMNGALPVRWMSNSQLAARSILESLVLDGRDDPLPPLYSGIKGSSLESVNKFIREVFKPDRASLVIAGTRQQIGQVHGLKQDQE